MSEIWSEILILIAQLLNYNFSCFCFTFSACISGCHSKSYSGSGWGNIHGLKETFLKCYTIVPHKGTDKRKPKGIMGFEEYFHWVYVRKVNKAKYNRALLILRRTQRLCSFLFSQRQTLWHIRHLELLHPSNKKTQKTQNHYLLFVKKAKWKKSQSSLFVKACWRKIFKYISQKSVFFNTCYNESF